MKRKEDYKNSQSLNLLMLCQKVRQTLLVPLERCSVSHSMKNNEPTTIL